MEKPRSIAVVGNGKAQAAPDLAYVQLNLHCHAASLAGAKSGASERVKDLNAIVKQFKLAAKDVKSTSVSIGPGKRYDEASRRWINDGYDSTQNVKITFRKLDKLQALVEAVLNSSIKRITNISYSTTTMAQLKEQALVDALKNAKSKANILAKAAGVKIGNVILVEEAGARARHAVGGDYEGVSASLSRGSSSEPAMIAPPGDIETQASLTVIYELK